MEGGERRVGRKRDREGRGGNGERGGRGRERE